MIIGAAVCPGPPFLVPGVAEPLARDSADLIGACRRAIRGLPAPERLLLITAGLPGRPARVLPSGEPMARDPFRRRDLSTPNGDDAGSGAVVGVGLLARIQPDGVRVPVEVVETGMDPVAAGPLVTDRVAGRTRVGLLVVADGAACHGDHAPGRRDDRSAAFDDALARALAAGDPAELQRVCADRDLAGQLLAMTDPLLVLALVTAADPPTSAKLVHRAVPYGVGYLVASWHWTER